MIRFFLDHFQIHTVASSEFRDEMRVYSSLDRNEIGKKIHLGNFKIEKNRVVRFCMKLKKN